MYSRLSGKLHSLTPRSFADIIHNWIPSDHQSPHLIDLLGKFNGCVTKEQLHMELFDTDRKWESINLLLKSSGHQLIHERCDESNGGFPKGVKIRAGPISRIPGGDRVAVKGGVVGGCHLTITITKYFIDNFNKSKRTMDRKLLIK